MSRGDGPLSGALVVTCCYLHICILPINVSIKKSTKTISVKFCFLFRKLLAKNWSATFNLHKYLFSSTHTERILVSSSGYPQASVACKSCRYICIQCLVWNNTH